MSFLSSKPNDPNKAAMSQARRGRKEFEKLSLPELEEYILQNPELVGLLDAEVLGDTELSNIQTDPTLTLSMNEALENLRQRSKEGLTAQDKLQMEQMLGDVASQESSQRAAIDQEMMRRGMGDSGASIQAKIQSQQSGANQARLKALNMAAQANTNKMNAASSAGNMAQNMQSQKYNQDAEAAKAKDFIYRQNAMTRTDANKFNLGNTQNIENQRANIANQQAMVANQIAQQNYNNQLSKTQGIAGGHMNQANIAGNAPNTPSGMQQMLGGAAQGAAIGNQVDPTGTGAAWGAGIGAASSLLMAEDGGIAEMRSYQGEHDKQLEQDKKKQAAISSGLTQLSNLLSGPSPERKQISLSPISVSQPQNVMNQVQVPQFKDGGTMCHEDGTLSFTSDGQGDIVEGDSYERDRVDAKLNSKEMVLNVAQQQRLLDLIRGKISVNELGDEDIVEGVPADYQQELIEGDQQDSSMQELLNLLSRSRK